MDARLAWGLLALAVLVTATGAVALHRWRRRLAHREEELDARERDLDARRDIVLQLLSHELRTPLLVIAGGMETLAAGRLPDEDTAAALTDAVRRSAVRLERQASAVMAATDRLFGDHDPAPIGADELVRRAIAAFDAAEAERIRVVVDPCDLQLDIDARYAVVLLHHLLDNALKFGPETAPVDVVVRLDDGDILIEVADDGTTVAVDDRWFDPFSQADSTITRRHGGLGLGLTGASQLARRLGGDVRIGSRPTGGVTAVVHLPQVAGVGGSRGSRR